MSNSGVRTPPYPPQTAPRTPLRTDADAPRRGHGRALADLLPEIGGAAFRKFGFVQSSIIGRWPEIVGARFAAASMPESLRFPRGQKQDGTLHLIVKPAYGPMMQHVVPEIIERVNRFFGYRAVARVKLRHGAVTPPADGRPAKAPPSLKPIPLELGDSLRDIGDPELRTVLESLARSLSNSEAPAPPEDDPA